jgi:hypothetical protein
MPRMRSCARLRLSGSFLLVGQIGLGLHQQIPGQVSSAAIKIYDAAFCMSH